MSENQMISEVFREYRNRTIDLNGYSVNQMVVNDNKKIKFT